jgi:hypothetical protein
MRTQHAAAAIALVALALGAATAPAQSASRDDRILTAITGEQVERLLGDAGYGFERLTSETPAYRIEVHRRPVTVFIAANGKSLQFRTFVRDAGVTARQAIAWNRDKRFSKAYVNSEGDLNVEYDLLLAGGVTWATVQEGVRWMGVVVDSMKEYF